MPKARKTFSESALDDNPLWYKDAVIYEIHVRAFCDGNGDGIGDFRGLTTKLDYLQDLGVTALWLLPFYPSPLRDDGYDIADYTEVHPDYGTLSDFRVFLREAHRRGLRVITELVINHTSDQHAWFQRARQAKPGSKARDYYVWSDTPEKYEETRIIFKDFEPSNWAWDPVAKAYYWHRFFSHQPDLNFDNPAVHKALFDVLDFWLDMGIDGLRLDAIPYLYEREGTNCENLPETHAFLKKLRAHIDANYANRMLLAEANQWPEDAVPYFGDGDECHMSFHFPVMPRLFMALHMEDRFPIIDILDQTPELPATCQWALFLRNHDELTLEMVTDEDRDYMYSVYANDPRARVNLGIRRRLGPLLGGSRRKIELLNSLLFSLPGTPVIYYGDEIGMGDNFYLGDRNAVRTPMQWSADRNAGFSRANPQQLYLPIIIDPEHHYEAVNVEAQQQNFAALLWWMKRLILLRKEYQAFGQGSIEFLYPENRKVLAFIRHFENEHILVVANLSRFVNYAELDLSAYKEMTPVELFGQTTFPRIGELPYFIILGPHSFYWFKLELSASAEEHAAAVEARLPALHVGDRWEAVLRDRGKASLEKSLPKYLATCRWFGGKARRLRSVSVLETIPVLFDSSVAHLARIEVKYSEGNPEVYLLPLAFAVGDDANQIHHANPTAVLAELHLKGHDTDGLLYDALADGRFCTALLDAVARRRRFKGARGDILAVPTKAFRTLRGPADAALEPSSMQREQSNTSVIFGDRLILKVFRRVAPGVNPDLEISRFLTEAGFPHTPPLAGALEYRPVKGDAASLAILQGLVANEGDAWGYTLDRLEHYYDEVRAKEVPAENLHVPGQHVLDLLAAEIPPLAQEAVGRYLPSAQLLGQRTGELHVALASRPKEQAFAPEPFTQLYRRSLYQSMRSNADKALSLLAGRLKSLPEEIRADAERVLGLEEEIFRRFRLVLDTKITAMRIRCHGDYHLGQVLYTGKDFVIIDFEGEPARPISERRLKGSPLRDVAGMLRSFDYAAVCSLRGGAIRPEDVSSLEPWARLWRFWASVVYAKAYLEAAGAGTFLPRSKTELKVLLDLHLLEKATYELGYELNNRPDWIDVPIRGILEMLQPPAGG
jgi:maltose alpha-D-glucosyltransferase/alpha-amylase